MEPVLLPPNYKDIINPLIFLTGPIQGAPRWHNVAISLIHRLDQSIQIASPSRKVDEIYLAQNTARFKHSQNQEEWEQVDWEDYHLQKAADNGVILFWMPKEKEHFCDRAYAQTTRHEWGVWRTKYSQGECKIALGVELGFSGEAYIKYKASKEFPELPIYETLHETCTDAVSQINQTRS